MKRGCGQTRIVGRMRISAQTSRRLGRLMEDRPRFQTGPEKFGRPGLSGGLGKRWPGWNCVPTSHTERARMVTLHLYTGAPELYPNNPCPRLGQFNFIMPLCSGVLLVEVQTMRFQSNFGPIQG